MGDVAVSEESVLKLIAQAHRANGVIDTLTKERDRLEGRLDGMQDDLDLMRERAVRAETELNVIEKTLKEMDRAVKGEPKCSS